MSQLSPFLNFPEASNPEPIKNQNCPTSERVDQSSKMLMWLCLFIEKTALIVIQKTRILPKSSLPNTETVPSVVLNSTSTNNAPAFEISTENMRDSLNDVF